MRITKILTLILFLFPVFFLGCNQDKDSRNQTDKQLTSFAKRFDLYEDSDAVVLFDEAGDDELYFDKKYEKGIFIERENPRYVCLSSTHIAFLAALGEEKHIVGAPDSSFIFNKDVKKMIRDGSVKVVSNGAGLNNELIIDLQPTVIFTDRMRTNEMTLFEHQGIPIVYIEEFREVSPLARTEWIKVFGRIAGKTSFADSIFIDIKNEYENLSSLVQNNVSEKPKIFGGMEYQGVWYVCGAKSYMAEFYKDAGAQYLFSDNEKSASIPLDFEVVYDKGAEADFWRIIYSNPQTVSYDDLASLNIHYRDFPAYKNKKVIFCNPLETPYFEQGVVEPQIILSDLVYAIHPELLSDYNPKYYYLLQ